MKILVFIFLFSFPLVGISQFEIAVNPIIVKAKLNNKDSVITINYKNNYSRELLLWVGDWMIDKLEADCAYSYLARPIKNSVFLYTAKTHSYDFLNYHQLDEERGITLYSNYKLLFPGESFSIKIKCSDLITRGKQNKTNAFVSYSIIDISNLCMYLKNVKDVAMMKEACSFDEDKNFYQDSVFQINNIRWSFEKKYQNSSTISPKREESDLPVYPKEKITVESIQIPQRKELLLASTSSIVYKFHKSYSSILRLK